MLKLFRIRIRMELLLQSDPDCLVQLMTLSTSLVQPNLARN